MADKGQEYLYSPAYKVGADVAVAVGPAATLDGYLRLIYDRMNHVIQTQANGLLSRGNITSHEASELINARNQLLMRVRSHLSPFGQLYSEILKPRASLPDLDKLLKQKGTITAVLQSVGKTRQVVDKLGVVMRVGGPATIIVSITATAVVIAKAPADQRARVASREIGATGGSIVLGTGGMWAGCASAAALASPSLVLPVVGEITTGGACLVGGLVGGLGLGYLGHKLGGSIGETVHTSVSEFTWSR
jgi:hypothetical protein